MLCFWFVFVFWTQWTKSIYRENRLHLSESPHHSFQICKADLRPDKSTFSQLRESFSFGSPRSLSVRVRSRPSTSAHEYQDPHGQLTRPPFHAWHPRSYVSCGNLTRETSFLRDSTLRRRVAAESGNLLCTGLQLCWLSCWRFGYLLEGERTVVERFVRSCLVKRFFFRCILLCVIVLFLFFRCSFLLLDLDIQFPIIRKIDNHVYREYYDFAFNQTKLALLRKEKKRKKSPSFCNLNNNNFIAITSLFQKNTM